MGSNLKYNELTFQAIVDATPSAILLVNQEGIITYTNSHTNKLFGYSKNELIGKSIEILIPAGYRDKHPDLRDDYFFKPTTRSMGADRNLFALRKDGSEFPVEIGLNPLITVEGTLVLASIIDITERKKAQERFELVVESAPNAIILVDQDGVITLINKSTLDLFGYGKSELLYKKLEILIPERFRDGHPGKRTSFFASPDVRPMGAGRDLYALRKDGSEFPVEIGLNPIKRDDQIQVLASIINISERKKQESQIQKYLNELEHKNKELEQFAYIASHDLKEPLRTITSMIRVLEEDFAQNIGKDQKEITNYISDAANRMTQVINGLLDYSKIGQDTKLTTVDCNEILNEIQKDIASSIKDTKANLNIAKLPVLKGYRVELRLLFQNIITNAIKYSRKDSPPQIKIASKKEQNHWKISISDNGIGIEPEHGDKIFDIFQRLHTTNEFEGTGIGLAHCKKIVELHNGNIWFDSNRGIGTTFYITIPDNENRK